MLRQHLTRRNLVRAGVYGGISAGVAGTLFAPRGLDVRDGRHDRGENGLWLQHGWLGDDVWFAQNGGEEKTQRLRSDEALAELGARLSRHGIRDLFPHLCPAQPDGSILPVDVGATTRFARALPERRILPWIGGVLDVHVFPDTPRWRETFVASAVRLLHRRGELAGLHLNVEPCPSGHRGFLLLLDELRAAMPAGRLLSVAAYPPKTWLHPFADVHWEEPYYREGVDLIVTPSA